MRERIETEKIIKTTTPRKNRIGNGFEQKKNVEDHLPSAPSIFFQFSIVSKYKKSVLYVYILCVHVRYMYMISDWVLKFEVCEETKILGERAQVYVSLRFLLLL